MSSEIFAPVLITVYNRLNHFERCINSLKKNKHAEKTPLFIAIDTPFREEDKISNNQILNIAKNIKGFKSVDLFIRKDNYGSVKNTFTAINDIYNIYETLIYSEDDNEFSPFFLNFINTGLRVYEERPDIFAICGYQYPISIPINYKKDIYLWQGLSAWGFGSWKSKWIDVQLDIKLIYKWLNDKEHIKKIDEVSQHYKFALKNMTRTKQINGDGFISNYLVEKGMYSVFPTETYVVNHGHDGLGINKRLSKIYLEQNFITKTKFKMSFYIDPNEKINNQLLKYFSNYNRFRKRLKSYLYKFI